MVSANKSKIFFFFDDVQVSLKHRKELKKFVESFFKEEKRKLKSLNYIFCTDKKLLDINRVYLNHNYYTDTITFNLSDNKKFISGEVYISVDRVRENAKKLNTTIKSELHRVIFHGTLHLCGYKDKKNKEIVLMKRKENLLLQKYFYPSFSRET